MVPKVAQEGDHVAVRGLTTTEVTEAIGLLDLVRSLQAEQADDTRSQLVRALMASRVGLTAPATLAQAHRLAAERDALLATPVLTYAALRELRGDNQESSTRTWVSRARARRSLFTLAHGGHTLIPAFQLTADGGLRRELQPVLDPLLAARIDGWALWTWLTSASALLSGQVPEKAVSQAPDRVARAARRFATKAAA